MSATAMMVVGGCAIYRFVASTILSAGYREHSDTVGNANFTIANTGGNLTIANNGTAGDGLLVIVFDKQYVIDNNVILQMGVQVNTATSSGISLKRGGFDGLYDYKSTTDFPDHAAMVLKGSRIFIDVALASDFTTRHVYGLDLKNADRYTDGVMTADSYEDWDGNPKTINDFTTDYVTAFFAFSSNGAYTRTMTFDTIEVRNLVTDELLFTLDVSSITSELSGTIHDYGYFTVPSTKVRIRNLRHYQSPISFVAIQQTTSVSYSYCPQLQVVDSTIYYTWWERDGLNYQIWTAYSNLDGSGFTVTKQTTSNFSKFDSQLQVVGSTIYYVWWEFDGSVTQVWTAYSNLDGSGFTATKQTTSAFSKYDPQFQVVGNTIYYTWRQYESSGVYQIWTATSNLDGSSFVATKQTTSASNKYSPQLQVVGNTIYYVWGEAVPYVQVWTAYSNLDGSGFTATKQTTGDYNKYAIQLQVVGNIIYYTWRESDGSDYQIWTAYSNLDGSGFTATKQTTSAFSKYDPQFQVVDSTIYYVWWESDDSVYQIWTATSNLDGSSFVATKQTTSASLKDTPQLYIVNGCAYYVWRGEDDSSNFQVWMARMAIKPIRDRAVKYAYGLNVLLHEGTVQGNGFYVSTIMISGNKLLYSMGRVSSNSGLMYLYFGTSNLDGSNFSYFAQTAESQTIIMRLGARCIQYGGYIYYAAPFIGKIILPSTWANCYDIKRSDLEGGTLLNLWDSPRNEIDNLNDFSIFNNRIYTIRGIRTAPNYFNLAMRYMNLDGSGVVTKTFTTSAPSKGDFRFCLNGSKISYVYTSGESVYPLYNNRFYYAETDLNGNSWTTKDISLADDYNIWNISKIINYDDTLYIFGSGQNRVDGSTTNCNVFIRTCDLNGDNVAELYRSDCITSMEMSPNYNDCAIVGGKIYLVATNEIVVDEEESIYRYELHLISMNIDGTDSHDIIISKEETQDYFSGVMDLTGSFVSYDGYNNDDLSPDSQDTLYLYQKAWKRINL